MQSILRITFIASLLISTTAFSQSPKDAKSGFLYWYSPSTNSFMIVQDTEMKHQYSLTESSWKSEKLTVNMFDDKLSYYTPIGSKEHDYLFYSLCGNVAIMEGKTVNAKSFLFGSKNYLDPTIFNCGGETYFYGNSNTSKDNAMMYSHEIEKWYEEPIKNKEVPLISFARSIEGKNVTYIYGGQMYNEPMSTVYKFDGKKKEFTECFEITEKDFEAFDGGIIRVKSKYYIFNTTDEKFHLLKNKIETDVFDFVVDSKQSTMMIISYEKGNYDFTITPTQISSETLILEAETKAKSANNSKPNPNYLYMYIGISIVAFLGAFLVMRRRKK